MRSTDTTRPQADDRHRSAARRKTRTRIAFNATLTILTYAALITIWVTGHDVHPLVWWIAAIPMARVLFQELDARMGHANSTVGRPQAAAGVIAREMGMNVTRLSLRKFSSSAGVKVETLERLPSGESAWFNIMVGIAHLAQEVIDGPPSFPSTNQFQYKQQVIRKAKLDKDAYRAAVLINADRLHLADFEEEAKPRNIINYALRAAVRILDAHQEEVGALAKALRKEKTLDADRIRDILAPWTPTTPQGGAS